MAYLGSMQEKNKKLESQLPPLEKAYFAARHLSRAQDGFIDFSSAMDMQVASLVWPKKVRTEFSKFSISHTSTYPGVVSQDASLEQEAVRFFQRQFNLTISPDEVFVTNGSLTSPSMLMCASPFKVVIHPDRYFSSQVAAFRAAGKTTIACPTDEFDRLDIPSLEKLVQQHQGDIAFIHLHHCQGAALTPAYLDKIFAIAEKYDTYLIYDADVIATAHKPNVNPRLALEAQYRRRFIVLVTFAKEFGSPAIRIGLAIGPSEFLSEAKKFQRHKIEIMPAPSVEIGKTLLRHVDIKKSGDIFHQRMMRTLAALRELGWKIETPDMGINLFVDAPLGFQQSKEVTPGTLFSYYLLRQCKVLVRPGIMYGTKLSSTVRFVLSPYLEEINEVFHRFKEKGVHYHMDMPSDLINAFQGDAAQEFAVM